MVLFFLQFPIRAGDIDQVIKQFFFLLLGGRDADRERPFLSEFDDLIDHVFGQSHVLPLSEDHVVFLLGEVAVNKGGGDEGAHFSAGVDVDHRSGSFRNQLCHTMDTIMPVSGFNFHLP